MPKKIILLMVTLCMVLVGVLLTFEITLAVDARETGGVELIPAGQRTKTPTPTKTKVPKATKIPKATAILYTWTPRPTSPPSIAGTQGVLPTPIQGPPPDFGGGTGGENSVLVDPLIGKLFVASGFPGVSQGTDDQGMYAYAKNHQQEPTLWAYWYIQVQQSGYYDVYAYIPTNPTATHSAEYHVFQNNQLSSPIVVDQVANAGRWANLGSYYFVQGDVGSQYVSLDNQTKESEATSVVLCSTVYLAFRP